MLARAWGVEQLSPAARVAKAIDAGVDQFGGEGSPELVVDLVRAGTVDESRIDVSARRLLREEFVLGLFDRPMVDVENALTVVSRPDFVKAGAAAQRAAVTRLTEAESGPAALPLASGLRVYREGFTDDQVADELGVLVRDPAGADLAVLRLAAPYEERPGRFEGFFHAGSLEFAEAELDRILAICAAAPTIVVLFLDRPAVVPEIADAAAALIVEFGASDEAIVDVLLGRATARGRLPFDLPILDAGGGGESVRYPVRHRPASVSIRRRSLTACVRRYLRSSV